MNEAYDAIVIPSDRVPKESVSAGTGTSKQVLISHDAAPNFAMRRFQIEPGCRMPAHTNTVEHEQFILKGKAKIGIGQKVYLVKAGDVVFIPKGIPHWYETEGNEPFVFLCMVPNLPDEIKLVEDT